MKGRRYAVGFDVLLSRSQNEEPALTVLLNLVNKGHNLVVPVSVVHEIEWTAQHGSREAKVMAALIKKKMASWGIVAERPGKAVSNGIAAEIARAILTTFPENDLEENDAMVLADSSLLECEGLISYSPELIKIPTQPLAKIFVRFDCKPIVVLSPRDFV